MEQQQKIIRQQTVEVEHKGKVVRVRVFERMWTQGSMGMHVEGVIKGAEQVAQAAYQQLVKEQKIISSYVLVPELTKKAAPASGAFVEFMDYRTEEYKQQVILPRERLEMKEVA